MLALVATLGAISKSHACVPDPQCLACEQSFEACVPDPTFNNDEEIRFEYADGMCSCNKDTCEAQEQHYSFVDPVIQIPVVVYRLKCCSNAMKCPTSTSTTTSSSSITSSSSSTSSTSSTSTMNSTMITAEPPDSFGSGDGSGDDTTHARPKSGALAYKSTLAIVMLPALYMLSW